MLTQRMIGLTTANLYTGDYSEVERNETLYELISRMDCKFKKSKYTREYVVCYSYEKDLEK